MDLKTSGYAEQVLRQPARARLFELIGELKRPVFTEDLAARVGLHRSGVRVHLERLESAGLIERHRVRQSRGRPRDAWSISPEAQPGKQPPTGYAELAAWLAAAIPPQPARLREIEASGRRLGRRLVADGPGSSLEHRMHAAFAALGFQPRRRAAAPDLCLELGNCPYRDAVHANQPVVCTLHRGLTQGLLDVLEPDAVLKAFVPHDPDEAGCLIAIEPAPRPAADGR